MKQIEQFGGKEIALRTRSGVKIVSQERLMDDDPEQEALFYLEGPDEDGCVWISSTDAVGWQHNLGPAHRVAEVLSQWLASIDDGESFQLTHNE